MSKISQAHGLRDFFVSGPPVTTGVDCEDLLVRENDRRRHLPIDMIEGTKNAESRLGSNRERRSRIRTFDMACLAADHDDLESAESPLMEIEGGACCGTSTARDGFMQGPLDSAATRRQRVGAIWSSGIRRRLASTRSDPSSRQSPRSCAPTRAGKRRARRGRQRETIRSVPSWGHREFASWS